MPAARRCDPPVAVRAPDLALRDLGVEGGQTQAAPCEPRDVPALDTDMIELEDQWIGLTAVGAAATREDRPEVVEVAGDVGGRIRTLQQLVGIRATPPAAASGAPAMAVRADNFAPSDLRVDGRDGGCCADQRRDRGDLLADVVELQHDGISLAAIHAGVIAEEPQDVRSEVALPGLLGRSRLIAMELTARPEIGGEA
jgi:hypothetical protein